MATRFKGTDEIKASVANEELLPKNHYFYKFSLMNDKDCTVSINDSDPIFLQENIGFSTDNADVNINSFKFLEDGVGYFWIGGL